MNISNYVSELDAFHYQVFSDQKNVHFLKRFYFINNYVSELDTFHQTKNEHFLKRNFTLCHEY